MLAAKALAWTRLHLTVLALWLLPLVFDVHWFAP